MSEKKTIEQKMDSLKTILMGRDDGNSNIKLYTEINGEPIKLISPTVYADITERFETVTNHVKNSFDGLDLTITKETLDGQKIDLGRKLIGPTAVRFGGKDKRNRIKGKTKLEDDNLQFIGIGTQAYFVYRIYEKFGIDIKGNTIDVEVPTGLNLPYHESLAGHRNDYTNKNLGKYKVVFNSPFFADDKGNKLVINMNITKAKTGTEGVQALKSYIYKEDGKTLRFKDEELLDKIAIVIEGGADTTEIVASHFIQDIEGDEFNIYEQQDIKVKPVNYKTLTDGIEDGVGTALVNTIDDLKQKYPEQIDRNLERIDIEKAIYQNKGKLPNGVSVEEFYKKNMDKLTSDIVGKIVGKINANDVKNKVFKVAIGGGLAKAKYGSEMIINKLKAEGFDKTFMNEEIIAILDEPVLANAIGAYKEIYKEIRK